MTGFFTLTLFSAGLLATAALAQTTVPNSENAQPPAFHNNMMPVKPLPVHHHRHPAHKPANSTPSSTPPSTPKPPAAAGPDQGKPGMQTQDNNTTNMHTPGSENPADAGPGTPKA
jgi:hypothetical protein